MTRYLKSLKCKCTNLECGTISDYRGDFVNTIRPRKVCPACGKKFDVKEATLYNGPIQKTEKVQSKNGPISDNSPRKSKSCIGGGQGNILDQSSDGPMDQTAPNGTPDPDDATDARVTLGNRLDQSRVTTSQDIPSSAEIIFRKLDQRDVRIIMGLVQGSSQAELARTENISRKSIHVRVKALVDIGIIKEEMTYPRSYWLPEDLKGITTLDLKGGIRLHNVNIRHEILVKTNQYNINLRKLKHWKVKTWFKYQVLHKSGLKIHIHETNTPNVCYSLQVAGRSAIELKNNLEDKVLDIQDFVEQTMHARLSDPSVGSGGVDIVAVYCSDAEMEKFKAAYCKSDPDAVGEAKTKNIEQAYAQADKLVQVMNGNNVLSKEISQVKGDIAGKFETMTTVLNRMDENSTRQANTMEAVVHSIQALSELQLQMGKAITSISETLVKLAAGSQASSQNAPANGGQDNMYV